MHKVNRYNSHILNRYFLIFKNHILYACFIHISHSYVHLFCIYMRKIRLGLCTRNVQKKHKNMHIYGGHFFSSVTTIENPTDTVVGNTRTINTVMYLDGLDAYNNNVITVTAIDTLTGCTITLTDNLTKLSPCNDLLISIDNTINTLTYKAVITKGKEPYIYKWIYNTNNFEAIGSITSDTCYSI